jgi:hypothetical protein
MTPGSHQGGRFAPCLFKLKDYIRGAVGKVPDDIYVYVLFAVNIKTIYVFRHAHAHGGGNPDMAPSSPAALPGYGYLPGLLPGKFPGFLGKNNGQWHPLLYQVKTFFFQYINR